MYDFRRDVEMPANAFLEPNNPNAVFPQNAKPRIVDMRAHKMAGMGFTSIGNFRKKMSDRSKKTKYETIVKTPEELEQEANEPEVVEEVSDEEIDAAKMYTVDDCAMDFEKSLRVTKRDPTFK